MVDDPRLGKMTEGGLQLPALTLSGRVYTRPPNAIMMLDDTYLVVLDTFPPPGFHAEAVLDELRALIAPPKKRRSHASVESAGEPVGE